MLTLYERLPADELPFYLNLMAHLARAGVEVPGARARSHRRAVLAAERPARGSRRAHRRRAGRQPDRGAIARRWARRSRACIVAAQRYRARLTNRRGPAWWRQAARAVRPFIGDEQNELLQREVKFQTGFGKGTLPKGAIHGDLFCDNVLFAGGRVAGIIDFGFAATDFFAYDLAIAVNDWCIGDDGDGALDAARTDAMVARLSRGAPADRRRARAMAGAAARRRAAVLAVAALRPAPAASGRAHARARSRAVRAHPRARARRRLRGRSSSSGAERDGPPTPATSCSRATTAGAASRWLRESYRDVQRGIGWAGSACSPATTSRCSSSTSCR